MPPPKISSVFLSLSRKSAWNNRFRNNNKRATASVRRRRILGLSTLLATGVVLCFSVGYYSRLNHYYSNDAFVIAQQQQNATRQTQKNHPDTFLSGLTAQLLPPEQCRDKDDPVIEWQQQGNTNECTCTDPFTPVARGTTRWNDFHELWVKKATKMRQTNVNNTPLDVLLLGDSITERWMGTKGLAKVQVPEFRQVFDEYFDKSGSSTTATLQGAAFGGSGDTTQELQWHLENGLLQALSLSLPQAPRAVLLLIGTNNLGRVGCSKRHTLAGIVHVAHFIQNHFQLQQPSHPVVMLIHGLLPRNEEFGDGNYTLGYKWQQIQWINQQLAWYCTNGRGPNDWFYLDNGDLFLANDRTINATLMDDALHPTVHGYGIWAPRLVQQIRLAFETTAKQRH